LEKLILNHNSIDSITPATDSQFPSLKSLSISHNKIKEWKSVDALNSFQQLQSLRFTSNPLIVSLGLAVARQLLIARIATLLMLNGSSVRKQERIESEKFYIKHCVNNSNMSSQELESLNPRFKELVHTYGAPYQEKKEAQTLAEEIIGVTLTSFGTSIDKKLPISITIANLKVLCQRLFKIEPSSQKLYYKESKFTPFPELLDDDSRALSYYGVKEQGEIIVAETEH